MALQNEKLVLVCDKCFRACCWYGEFMCDEAGIAGTGLLPVQLLKEHGQEHPEFWSNAKFEKVYGTRKPSFSGEPLLYEAFAKHRAATKES